MRGAGSKQLLAGSARGWAELARFILGVIGVAAIVATLTNSVAILGAVHVNPKAHIAVGTRLAARSEIGNIREVDIVGATSTLRVLTGHTFSRHSKAFLAR